MTDPLDRSLSDMSNEKEVNEVSAEAMPVDEELDDVAEMSQDLARAYFLSGESPSLAAIEWAERKIALPLDSEAEVIRFTEGVRQRMESAMRNATGAPTIGGYIQKARRSASLDERQAAAGSGLPLPAYRLLEEGRMPVWRTPPEDFARFCRQLGIEGQLLVRWASITAAPATGSAFGRLDVHDEARTEVLEQLGATAADQARREFNRWREQFIAAYASASAGDAPSGR